MRGIDRNRLRNSNRGRNTGTGTREDRYRRYRARDKDGPIVVCVLPENTFQCVVYLRIVGVLDMKELYYQEYNKNMVSNNKIIPEN